jgi:hypothetical protein
MRRAPPVPADVGLIAMISGELPVEVDRTPDPLSEELAREPDDPEPEWRPAWETRSAPTPTAAPIRP